MSLPVEILSEFAKLTNDKQKTKSETTVYGTTVQYNDRIYVKLDGSELLTPVTTTTNMAAGERVTVLLKNHSAIVTGNLTSPSATSGDVSNTASRVDALNAKFDSLTAGTVTTEDLAAERARIDSLESENVIIRNNLIAANGNIDTLEANIVTINEELVAKEADITKLETEKLNADVAAITYATINSLNAVDADFHNLESTYAAFSKTTTDDLTAIRGDISLLETDKLSAGDAAIVYATIGSLNATNANITVLEGEFSDFKTSVSNQLVSDKALIESLEANKVSAKDIEGKYANIDFSNISKATMEYFYSESGLIRDVTVGDATITGHLVGVTISGDLIEGNTIKAEKLVIKGSDGLYYKLNTDGVKTEAEQTDVNSLNGSLLQAKSITATKISVDDLVAFDATIGGFNITEKAIHSSAKTSATNSTRGIYLDSTGQVALGDSSNFIKYYKDQNGDYRLEISADSLKLTTGNTDVETVINELAESTATNSADLTNFISAINSEMEHIQTQIDGSISTWFYAYVPTTSNIPASSWNTTDLKNAHLGDLFYDTDTGYCYRWQLVNNTYSWNRITDVDVTKALSDAAKAQSTADNKGRIFVSTPTTPYEVGDLWVQGTSGDIMRCQTTKTASQSYAAADWVKASKYTDDTKANAAKSAADAAQADVNAVETRMTAAETQITQNKEQIALRATKTELTSLSSDLSNNYYTKSQADSALTVKANEITSSVSSTYATKTALNTTNANVTAARSAADAAQNDIDNLNIGGRNLILKSANMLLSGSDNGNDNCCVIEEDYVKITPKADGNVYNANGVYTSVTRRKGEQYTISFEVLTPTKIGFYWYPNEHYSKTNYIQASDDWQKIVFTYTQTGDDASAGTLFGLNGLTAGEVYCYRNVKLETGNKATAWSPAPEDLENEVIALESRVVDAESSISQQADAIALRATKTEVASAKSEAISTASSDATAKANSALTSANNNTNNLLKSYATTAAMNSAIEVKANAITSSVSATYATKYSLETVQNGLDNLAIGGRNLFKGYGDEEVQLPNYNNKGSFKQFTNLTIDASDPEYLNKEFTISLWAKSPNGSTPLQLYNRNGSPRYFTFDTTLDSDLGDVWKYYTFTFTNVDKGESCTAIHNRIEIYAPNQMGVLVKKVKVEMGNRATDWSPAPEDIEARMDSAESSITQLSDKITANVTETSDLKTRMSTVEQTASGLTVRLSTAEADINSAQTTANTANTNASNAAKTATNYLGFSSSGLVVGDMTASTLGKNVLIDSDSVDIRNGTSTLASFGASTIYLGKNSDTSVINLCNGSATMRVKDDTDFRIYTDKRLVMSAYSSMLLDCYRDSTHMTRIAIQSADPDVSSVVGGVQFTIYQGDVENTVKMLGNDIELKVLNGSSQSRLIMDETMLKLYSTSKIYINSKTSVQIAESSSYSAGITLGYTYIQNKSINIYWSDGEIHDLIANANGQTTYIGPGDIDEATTTNVRGKYVRLYAHEGGGVYLGYSGSTAITSDRNMKTDILDIDDKYIDFFDRLRPITYKYDCPENRGHRDHVGFVAQEVEEALIASGLTSEQFAGLVIEEDVTLNPNYDSHLSDEENAANETHYDKLYSLRYEEFISLLVKKVQSLQEQINELRTDTAQ